MITRSRPCISSCSAARERRAREGGAARGAAGRAGSRSCRRTRRRSSRSSRPGSTCGGSGRRRSTCATAARYVRYGGREIAFTFAARHQAANAVAALAVVRGARRAAPGRGRSRSSFSRWRSQESELPGGGLLINDAWNANPVAMRAALEYLVERAAGRRTVAILGEMAELGENAAAYHDEIGRRVRELGVDVVFARRRAGARYRRRDDAWSPTSTTASRARAGARASSSRATSCSSRARARSGSRSSPRRSRESRRR